MTSPIRPVLLIVDDDPLIRESLELLLGTDFVVVLASTRAEAIERVRALDTPPPLALVDLGLPPLPHRPDEGFALIGDLLAHAPAIRIVVLSGQDDEENARHARTLGAADFVGKPADPGQLVETLLRVLNLATAATPLPDRGDECQLVGESLAMQKLRVQVKQYANSPFPVLIEGESGAGKEIVANCCLHRLTDRRQRPYFALNCAAISPNLVEPTLFGYAKGAFTGATSAKTGYFEDAADGTLFLDEIGELPLELQPKLLRVLENGEFQRVGETQTRRSSARVVTATNRDLRLEVREGRFRADLYHRLSVFTISVPALRDMGRDRLLLLHHYRRLCSAQLGTEPFVLTPEAELRWLDYPFPGNVRELRNIVLRLTARFPGLEVDVPDLEAELDVPSPPVGGAWLPPQDPRALIEVALRQLQGRDGFSLDEALGHWETAYIEAAQRLSRGNLSQAARLLGINRTTLYNRIETLSRKPASRDEWGE